jgi:integrase
MKGTITKNERDSKKPSWGYYFAYGRDEAGKRLQVTKSGFRTKGEADDALKKAILKATAKDRLSEDEEKKAVEEFKARRDTPVQTAPTFAAFFDRWMDEHVSRKCSPKTIERYRELGAYAIRQNVELAGSSAPLGSIGLDKFRPMHMELMMNALRDHGGQVTKVFPDGRPLSPKSVRHIGCVVHGCFEKAVRWEIIPRNPMTGIDLPRLEKKDARVVEKDAVSKLLKRAKDTRLYPLILLGLATGARRGEMLALKWPDVDFISEIVSITKSLEQTKAGLRVKSTKSGKPRRFAVPAVALEALKRHRAEQDNDRAMFLSDYQENDLVFCRPEGGYYSPDRVGARVSELMRKAGVNGVSLHNLRHTHASELLSQGVPITTVAKRLGHANANITLSIYAVALEADELAAAKTWGDSMADVLGTGKKKKTAGKNVLQK